MANTHLFVGPKGTGRWTEAEELRKERGILNSDILRIRKLTNQTAQDIVNFALFAPVGEEKMCIVRLPSSNTKATQILLKTLEEAPDFITFVLIAKTMPNETIVSRSKVKLFSLLSEEDIAAKVLKKKGIGTVAAQSLAKKSGGQMSRVYDILNNGEQLQDVIVMAKALVQADVDKVESLAPGWTDIHTDLLAKWAKEAIIGTWVMFPKSDVPKLFALKVLMALNTEARPRLVVRSVLADLIRK